MTPMSVNSLETEPTRYTVDAVAGMPPAEAAQPKPRAHTMRLPSTSAREIAGMLRSARALDDGGQGTRDVRVAAPGLDAGLRGGDPRKQGKADDQEWSYGASDAGGDVGSRSSCHEAAAHQLVTRSSRRFKHDGCLAGSDSAWSG